MRRPSSKIKRVLFVCGNAFYKDPPASSKELRHIFGVKCTKPAFQEDFEDKLHFASPLLSLIGSPEQGKPQWRPPGNAKVNEGRATRLGCQLPNPEYMLALMFDTVFSGSNQPVSFRPDQL